MRGNYLLRCWGGDLAKLTTSKTPDAMEPDDDVACYWFETSEAREAFIASWPLGAVNLARDRKDAGLNDDGEHIDVHHRTVCDILLRLPDGRTHQLTGYDFGYGYPEGSAKFMWYDGNYSCDCNKRLFLSRDGFDLGYDPDADDAENPCGDTITIEAFVVRHEP